mgnify:CR=1 FL=1
MTKVGECHSVKRASEPVRRMCGANEMRVARTKTSWDDCGSSDHSSPQEAKDGKSCRRDTSGQGESRFFDRPGPGGDMPLKI